MATFFSRTNWLTGVLIFFMPVSLVIFLGSQMAYSQVNSKFEDYKDIPELTSLSELAALPADQLVMLRGHVAEGTTQTNHVSGQTELLIYQERPADGREVRYREEFPLVFPAFVLELSDGLVAIEPSLTREKVMQEELHMITIGDREFTGFRAGDLVTVQGQWQPTAAQPALIDVTGITGLDKQTLMADWEAAFQKVGWVRNAFGAATLVGLIVLVIELRRIRLNKKEEKNWKNQTTKTAPTASP
jgi:hypothetical protein